jgi:hypothetical protein
MLLAQDHQVADAEYGERSQLANRFPKIMLTPGLYGDRKAYQAFAKAAIQLVSQLREANPDD